MSGLFDQLLLSKFIETPNVKTQDFRQYQRRELINKTPESSLYPDEQQRNPNLGKNRLEAQYNKKKQSTGLRHEDLCIGDITPDPRGVSTDPRFVNMREIRENRAKAAVPYMGANTAGSVAQSVWTDSKMQADRQKMNRMIKTNLDVFENQQETTMTGTGSRTINRQTVSDNRRDYIDQGRANLSEVEKGRLAQNTRTVSFLQTNAAALKTTQENTADPVFRHGEVMSRLQSNEVSIKQYSQSGQKLNNAKENQVVRRVLYATPENTAFNRSIFKSGIQEQDYDRLFLTNIAQSMRDNRNNDTIRVSGLAQLSAETLSNQRSQSAIGYRANDSDMAGVVKYYEGQQEFTNSRQANAYRTLPQNQNSGPLIWSQTTNSWVPHKENNTRSTKSDSFDPFNIRNQADSTVDLYSQISGNMAKQGYRESTMNPLTYTNQTGELSTHKINATRKSNQLDPIVNLAQLHSQQLSALNNGLGTFTPGKANPYYNPGLIHDNMILSTDLKTQHQISNIGKNVSMQTNDQMQWNSINAIVKPIGADQEVSANYGGGGRQTNNLKSGKVRAYGSVDLVDPTKWETA